MDEASRRRLKLCVAWDTIGDAGGVAMDEASRRRLKLVGELYRQAPTSL